MLLLLYDEKRYVCVGTHMFTADIIHGVSSQDTYIDAPEFGTLLSVTDSHGLVLYCYVTITAPLFCIAGHVIATVPRLVITCSLSVSVSLCQMKREKRIDVWVESLCPEGSINSEQSHYLFS